MNASEKKRILRAVEKIGGIVYPEEIARQLSTKKHPLTAVDVMHLIGLMNRSNQPEGKVLERIETRTVGLDGRTKRHFGWRPTGVTLRRND